MRKLILTAIIFCFMTTMAFAVGNVTFRWDANSETDLAKYKLYQAEAAGGPYVKSQVVGEGNLVAIVMLADLLDVANPEYTLTNVADGTHYWVLTAADLANNESLFSNEVTTTIDGTSPAPPGGFNIWEVIIAWVKKFFSWFSA